VHDKAWSMTPLSGADCTEADHPLASGDGALLGVASSLSVRSIFHKGGDATVSLVVQVPDAPPGPLGAATSMRSASVEVASTLLEEGRTRKSVLYIVENADGPARFGDPVDGFKDVPADPEARDAALKAAAVNRERIAVIPGPRWTVGELLSFCRVAGNEEATCALVPAARSGRIVDLANPAVPSGPVAREKRIVGRIKLRDLEAALVEYAKDTDGCYLREAVHDRDLAGSVLLKFKLGPDGKAANVVVRDSDLPERVTTCLQKQFEQMELPKPADGGTALVTWPLFFEPKK
jgi:hypothetical protein